jgi:hypothetical protein
MQTLLANDLNSEPPASVWRDPATYDQALVRNFITLLEAAEQRQGTAPNSLQLTVLEQLHWYFTVDLRERAPTVALTAENAPAFHDRVRQIMRHINAQTLETMDSETVSVEVRHALLSYHAPILHSEVALDAYDHDQGLVRLSYYHHGKPPAESFVIDGAEVKPAYAKYRACRYYHRNLLRQRIVWLPVANARTMEVRLAGELSSVGVGPQPFAASASNPLVVQQYSAAELLPAARAAFHPGKGGQKPLPKGWAGWKVRLMLALARFPLVRKRFNKAWVFTDRESDADDNAEHLYRWVREHHPEINAWFLLSRTSHDWPRLQTEGFRLVPTGLLRRLLILNSEHLISSHTDYAFGAFDRRLYGDAMRWRYTFLQHGVIKDDISHWLSPCEFDCFVTSSPAEHSSVVGDGTPYPYTAREVRRTGLQRHDRLLRLSKSLQEDQVNLILVMPTWRAGLVDARMGLLSSQERMQAFFASDYARHWRSLLRNEELGELAKQHGKRLAFMPHPNAMDYIEAFDTPAHVDVVTLEASKVQQIFAKSASFITDYTSVAFTMAFLRRQVFYYQFDRGDFYGGGHNWRAGYFDYDRDGFGPVGLTEDQMLVHLRRFFANNAQPEPMYLARMESAMPERDDQACRRVFESIMSLKKPFLHS